LSQRATNSNAEGGAPEFDALTASDRPYKRAVPVQKALDILGFEVKDNHVDGELVRIFTEAKVWESVVLGPASAR